MLKHLIQGYLRLSSNRMENVIVVCILNTSTSKSQKEGVLEIMLGYRGADGSLNPRPPDPV